MNDYRSNEAMLAYDVTGKNEIKTAEQCIFCALKTIISVDNLPCVIIMPCDEEMNCATKSKSIRLVKSNSVWVVAYVEVKSVQPA